LEVSLAFNGSGVHNRVHDWTEDLTDTIPVTASRMDAEHDDMSSSLSNTICRDGQSTTTARIPFASGVSTAAGTTASVAYAQTNDPNTGLYFPGSDQWGLAAGGAATLSSSATKLTAAVAVDFTGVVAPTSSDGAVLDSTAQMWSDLFLASGAVINFNNGDVTATHSANALAFAGASSGYTFDAALTVSSGGAAITGNSTVTGTLGVSGNFAVNTDKFTVTAASGNTVVAGMLGVTGDVAVNTNKFNVTASSGNTTLAGTLGVTGATTLAGALSANNLAGVTARNTPKAFVYFTTDGSANVTVNGSFNVSGVAIQTVESRNGFRLTFSSALPSANFTVLGSCRFTINNNVVVFQQSTRATTTFDFLCEQSGVGATRNNLTCDIVFFDAG
jgi:hypothetical protein